MHSPIIINFLMHSTLWREEKCHSDKFSLNYFDIYKIDTQEPSMKIYFVYYVLWRLKINENSVTAFLSKKLSQVVHYIIRRRLKPEKMGILVKTGPFSLFVNKHLQHSPGNIHLYYCFHSVFVFVPSVHINQFVFFFFFQVNFIFITRTDTVFS